MTVRPFALVTGGTRGIGLACAHRLAQEGFDLLLVYRERNREARQAVDALLEISGVELLQCDVADPEAVSSVLVPALKRRAPSVYIHCAGRSELRAAYAMDREHIAAMLGNLSGFLLVLAPVMRSMVRKGGAVVAITSIAGRIGLPGQTAYSSAKAGMTAAVRAAAKEGSKFGIRVNAVMPCKVATEGLLVSGTHEATDDSPIVSPAQVAEVVWHLCSGGSQGVSGTEIEV